MASCIEFQLQGEREPTIVHPSPVDSCTSQEDNPTAELLPVVPSTAQPTAAQIAHSLIAVTSVPGTAQAKGSPVQ